MGFAALSRRGLVQAALAGALGVLLVGGAAAAQASGGGSTTSTASNGSAATATVNVAQNSKLGSILVGSNGKTLYYFKKDHMNTTVCYGKCAGLWPALTVATGTPSAGSGVTGTLGLITRKGGGMQVTYNGVPLYYFSGDSAAGQTNGEGFLKIWYAATPSLTPTTAWGAAAAAPAAATTATATATATPAVTAKAPRLPKTGSDPLFEVLGGALLLAGAALLLRRARPGSHGAAR